jgi:cytochrome b
MKYTVRVWDAPTRLFHWLLAACVVGLVTSAQIGGSAMEWHFRLGYTVFSLLLFRIVWGLVGGHWSRFSSFFYTPGQILAYLSGRGDPNHSVGHNPLGAFSVVALLGFLFLQVGSGLISDDEIAAAGPLTRFVSGELVSTATYYHKEIGKLILLALVTAHLLAIAFYRIKKGENLVKPMLTGDKILDFEAKDASDRLSDRVKALSIVLVCAALIAGTVVWLS